MARPQATAAALRAELVSDDLLEAILGDVAERPPAQRHTEARSLLEERRVELVQLADLMRERDGTVVDVERLVAEDKLSIGLRTIIDTP